MENKIERKLVEKVNQIKFSLLIFLTLSLYMVGFFAVIGIVILLIVSYIIGGYIAKGFENFKIKEEFCKIKGILERKEEVKVIKEDLKGNSEEFKKFIKEISDYDYFSKIKMKKDSKKRF